MLIEGGMLQYDASISKKRRLTGDERPSDKLSSLACQRCRARKVKCDASFPTCTACAKAQVPCLISDSTASREYTRDEVCQLEEKIRQLEVSLGKRAPDATRAVPAVNPSPSNARPGPGRCPGGGDEPTRFVSSDGGIGFTRYIYAALTKSHPGQTVRDLFVSNTSGTNFEYCPPHNLPDWPVTFSIMTNYFSTFHVANPFLERSRLWCAADRVYQQNAQSVAGSSDCSRELRQDLFQVCMVLAIGSISAFRRNETALHPFGFFTAALKSLSPVGFSFGELQDIENFLLISHFGVFYHIGCSIWELSQLSMRMCVELGLHRQTRKELESSTRGREQRRRVFWASYSIDRLASSTLGRPPSLEESDIHVDLPSEGRIPSTPMAPDVDSATNSLPEEECSAGSEVTVFNHLIRLARISSRIVDEVVSLPKAAPVHEKDRATVSNTPLRAHNQAGGLFPLVKKFDKELHTWLQQAPSYESPSCVHQMTEKFELEYQIARFSLLRASIDRVSHANSSPPNTLLRPCINAAMRIIHQYEYLRVQSLITYTRRFTHLILSAGLILLSAAFREAQALPGDANGPTNVDCESWWVFHGDNGNPSHDELSTVLTTTGAILAWFATKMPDMSVYSHFFEALRRQLFAKPRLRNPAATSIPTTSSEALESRYWPGQRIVTPHGHNDFDVAPPQLNVATSSAGIAAQPYDSQWVTRLEAFESVFTWPVPAVSDGLWSFSHGFQGIEDVELGLSGLDWDANILWNTPSTTEGELDAFTALGSG